MVHVGDVVKFKVAGLTQYFRVRSIRGSKCNLCGVYSPTIFKKGVPVNELVECGEEWWAKYSQSESYMCS